MTRTALVPEFRFIFVSILGVIVPFGLLLYLLPTQTAVYWAWVIPDPRSAMLIGAGYFGAIAYYVLALRENDWEQMRLGLGGLIIFSLVLLAATMIHWEMFRDYHLVTLVWLLFYYSGPVLVPIARRMQLNVNAKQGVPDTRGESGDTIQPPWRTWLLARAIFFFVLAILGVIFADAISAQWPWSIRPLELRVFMGQVAIVAWNGTGVLFGFVQWRQYRLGLIFSMAVGALQLIALLINIGSYNWSAPFGIILPLIFLEWVLTPALVFATRRSSRAVLKGEPA